MFCALIHAHPGLTDESRTYLDSCADCVFRKRTPIEPEKLMAKISKNYDDWTTSEPITPESTTPEPTVPELTPKPTPKKRGVIELNDEVMKEAKKCLKEKGIKYEYVKNLPPI